MLAVDCNSLSVCEAGLSYVIFVTSFTSSGINQVIFNEQVRMLFTIKVYFRDLYFLFYKRITKYVCTYIQDAMGELSLFHIFIFVHAHHFLCC